jgi:hypothetical protein
MHTPASICCHMLNKAGHFYMVVWLEDRLRTGCALIGEQAVGQ